MPKKMKWVRAGTDDQVPFLMRDGYYYVAVTCKTCGSPIPFGLSPERPAGILKMPPNTRLLLACVSADCHKEHTYERAEIVSFEWRGKKKGE